MPLGCGHANALHGAALYLRGEALRMQHRPAIGDADVVEDVVLAGLGVELDLHDADRDAGDHALARIDDPLRRRSAPCRRGPARDVVISWISSGTS